MRDGDAQPAMPSADDRLFVSIADLGAVLGPAERLRTVYPRYIEMQATAGPDGLAVVAFRTGTPYESEDLIYLAERATRGHGLLKKGLTTRPLFAVPYCF